jgi:hypothetical protein
MTATIETTKTEEAIAEITANIQEGEDVGRVLGVDGGAIRIKFKSVERAAGWLSDYATPEAASFETAPATMASPATMRLSIAAYIEANGI